MSIISGTNETSPIKRCDFFKIYLVSTITECIMGHVPAGIMSHYFQCHELNHDKASLTDGMYLAAFQKRGIVVNTR